MNAKLILTGVFSAVLLTFPAESYGAVTNIEEEVLYTLQVEDGNVRAEWLSWLHLKSGLTDNEFSDILVRTADMPEVRKEPWLRGFTLAAISDFGTTNALEYLEREALHGPDVLAGIKGYSIITGFDYRCFDLLARITADESFGNCRRRSDVYWVLDYVLNPGADHLTRCVNSNDLENVRQRAIDFLIAAAEKEKDECTYLDRIIVQHAPEYAKSERRKAIAQKLLSTDNPPQYIVNYFGNELQKLEAEETRVKAEAVPQSAPMVEKKGGQSERTKRREYSFGIPGIAAIVICLTAVFLGIAVILRRRREK